MNKNLSSEPILQSGATSPTDTVLPERYPTVDQLSSTRATAIEVVRAYLQAWNDHDGVAVTRQFAPNGTYVDPTLPGPLSGEDIAMYVAGWLLLSRISSSRSSRSVLMLTGLPCSGACGAPTSDHCRGRRSPQGVHAIYHQESI
jgi:hypothetical protein